MSGDLHSYQQQLLLALRLYDVPGPRIAEALAEVESHVRETGEDATEAFGAPKAYAAQLSTALGAEGTGTWAGLLRSLTWVHAVVGLVSFGGCWMLTQGLFAFVGGRPGPFGLPAVASGGIGAVLLGALAVALVIDTRRDADPVRDPRTGADMTGPPPRWAFAVSIAAMTGLVLVACLVSAGQAP